MKLTIQYKLFLAMMASAVVLIGYMAAVIQWSFDKGFLEYIDTAEQEELELLSGELEKHFAQHKSWEMLKNNPIILARLHIETLPESKKKKFFKEKLQRKDLPEWILEPEETFRDKRPLHPMARTIVLSAEGQFIFGKQQNDSLPELLPLHYQNRKIGSLGRYSPKIPSDNHQLLFVRKQKLIILLVGVAALFITIGLSLPLAFHLTKPVRRISAAAKNLIAGNYATRVQVISKDELGQLSRDINTLAQTLEKNEIDRKQWVSDIAHELRTPLTSLQGEIEAVEDGIRQPDKQTFKNLHAGVMRLNHLVADLYDLSKSEPGAFSVHFEQIDLLQLIKLEAEAKQIEIEKAGLSLIIETKEQESFISGDMQRLQQLISNLLSNSINYTDKGGTIELKIHIDNNQLQLDIVDTAPGVPETALPHLFTRLYRVEESRNRALGGSGLGLAICKKIVLAHQGTIKARPSSTGGLWIQVTFPQSGEN